MSGREQRLEDEAAQLIEDFRAVAASPAGKRVLFFTLGLCGVYQDGFCADPYATSYVAGKQAIGKLLIGKLDEVDPHTYPQLLLEVARERALSEAAERKESDGEDAFGP